MSKLVAMSYEDPNDLLKEVFLNGKLVKVRG